MSEFQVSAWVVINPPLSSYETRSPNTIRASEISSFLYCRRAWAYQREGAESANEREMLSGTEMHIQHGRTVLTAGLLRSLAYVFLLAALVLGTVYMLNQIF
jgi:hypothetical protein